MMFDLTPQQIATIGILIQVVTIIFVFATWKAKRESSESAVAGKLETLTKRIEGWEREHKESAAAWERRHKDSVRKFDESVGQVRQRHDDLAETVNAHGSDIEVLKVRVAHLEPRGGGR
jgi:hypothetical protein